MNPLAIINCGVVGCEECQVFIVEPQLSCRELYKIHYAKISRQIE